MKRCTKCDIDKPVAAFGKRSRSPDGLQRYCRECNAEYQRQHYVMNKPAYLDRNQRVLEETRIWFAALKEGKPCHDCGGTFHPCAMDYDHLSDNKLFDVSDMLKMGRKKILEEIDKCELVCSNCHRVRTFLRRTMLSSSTIG